jgi:hypothetical protein
MLSGGGEKMEEVARVLIDVGDSLDGARKATAGQVQSLAADITETINRRNAYMADNAAVLTPEAAAADQRLLQQTVDAVRSPVIELRPARVRPDRVCQRTCRARARPGPMSGRLARGRVARSRWSVRAACRSFRRWSGEGSARRARTASGGRAWRRCE